MVVQVVPMPLRQAAHISIRIPKPMLNVIQLVIVLPTVTQVRVHTEAIRIQRSLLQRNRVLLGTHATVARIEQPVRIQADRIQHSLIQYIRLAQA